MYFEHKHFKNNIDVLIKTLNSINIKCHKYSDNENSLEIYFNDNQRDIVLNMLSQIDTYKNGFVFKIIKNGNKKEKSVIVTFYRNPELNCGILTGYLNSTNYSYNLNSFNKLDIILDSFPYDNITFSIKKNIDINEGYLITLDKKMTNEELNGKGNIVLNNEELKSRLIHTIASQNEDGSYNVTYGLFYESDEDLDNLLNIKNINYNIKPKKIIKKYI